uniref:Uncharacterized protein n=1 Tax=Medicago truncatula TaxID=3880 RepID=A2Q668_MEDTR|nr:hypothetical protein MtrDRAFT_AC173289g19v1 [Medicago truncatula]
MHHVAVRSNNLSQPSTLVRPPSLPTTVAVIHILRSHYHRRLPHIQISPPPLSLIKQPPTTDLITMDGRRREKVRQRRRGGGGRNGWRT